MKDRRSKDRYKVKKELIITVVKRLKDRLIKEREYGKE